MILSRSLFIVVAVIVLSSCGGGGSSTSSTPEDPPVGVEAFSVSGSVTVGLDSGIDVDVEERTNRGLDGKNNNLADAQDVTNPVTLGGYVSGTEGRYSTRSVDNNSLADDYFKDSKDYFRVSLIENQQLTLSIFYADQEHASDTGANRIDVDFGLRPVLTPEYLADSANLSSEGSVALTAPTTEEYFVQILALENISSPTLYTLSISPTTGGASVVVPSLSANFKPGEVLIQYKAEGQEIEGLMSSSRVLSSAPAQAGLSHDRRIGKHGHLYKMEAGTLSGALTFEQGVSASGMSSRQQSKWQTLQVIEALKKQPNVLFAEPNYYMRASGLIEDLSDIKDTEYDRQWNLAMVNAPAAWFASSGEHLELDGSGEVIGRTSVRVAVIDTGINSTHADLNDNLDLINAYDFVSDPAIDGDGVDGRDSDPSDPSLALHGTHVAGIIAAEGNETGIRGLAYDAKVLPLRVLGETEFGLTSDIASAMLYAAGLDNDSGRILSDKVDIINLSLGSNEYSTLLRNTVASVVDEGIIIVAAAGNDSTSVLEYPAAYDGVIGVSSVNEFQDRSLFSNFGSYVDVAAPGGTSFSFGQGILSTLNMGEYEKYSGTSMAAPHVAGVAALMKALDPNLDNLSFSSYIESGDITDDISSTSYTDSQNLDYFGAGLINASKAIQKAGGVVSTSDSLLWFPSQFRFVGNDSTARLILSNPGDGVVDVSVSASEPWVSVNELNVGATGLGQYNVEIDLSQLTADAIFEAELTLSYTVNGGAEFTETIALFASKTTQGDDSVGNLSIFLVNKEIADNALPGDLIPTAAIVGGALNQGTYHFMFSNIPAGEYYLKASTDNDGDYVFFDQGEAIGEFPQLFSPEAIVVDEAGVENIQFDAGYQSFSDTRARSAGQTKAASAGYRATTD